MKDQLITFETAKLAKEKGFNEKISKCYYLTADNVKEESLYPLQIAPIHYIPRPTQSLLQKWLREKHNIGIFMQYRFNHRKHTYDLYNMLQDVKSYMLDKTPERFNNQTLYNTYEEALEIALQEGLKLIKL